MSQLKANCPNCVAPIEFKAGSTIVLVCPFCRSAVARTDRKLEDLGRVAEIVQSSLPLKLGLRGNYDGNKFELTGRAQIRHGAGGFWDEWYATFSDGRVGWLAEAQGKFYMTFHKPLSKKIRVPSFKWLKVGRKFDDFSSETPLIIHEKGTATYIAAEGEIPYKLNPNEQSDYADLSGKNGVFATIDYSTSPPYLFYGQEVTLADLGLANKGSAKREPKRVSVASKNCPKCGGALELKAPDKSERVTCPFCNSLLDVNKGNLKFLKSLKLLTFEKNLDLPIGTNFDLPIGAKGSFENFADGAEFEVIGAMVRSVFYDKKYYWDEYLLYNPKVGFRWLLNSEKHWSFVEPISVAEVDNTHTKKIVTYLNEEFEAFASASAKVEYVEGEFYWQVEQGESVEMTDYVAPPLMLSKESTSDELNWSLGTYLEKRTVEKAFDINLVKPYGIAPNQPYKYDSLIRSGLIMLAISFLVGMMFFLIDGNVFNAESRAILSEVLIMNSENTTESEIEIYSSPFHIRETKYSKDLSVYFKTNLNRGESLDFNLEVLPTENLKKTNNSLKVKTVKVSLDDYGYKARKTLETVKKGAFLVDYSDSILNIAPGEYKVRIRGSGKIRKRDGTEKKIWEEPFPIHIELTKRDKKDWKAERYIKNLSILFLFFVFLFLVVPVIMILNKWSFESIRWKESDYSDNNKSSKMSSVIGDIFSGK